MYADRASIPRAAVLVLGFAAGAVSRALAGSRHGREIAALKRSLAGLEGRLDSQDAAWREAVRRIEVRLDEHQARFEDIPSAAQINAASEALLSRTMQSLNEKMAAQSDAIELLKATVAHTDSLLERVVDALHALRPEPAEAARRGEPR